MNIEDVLKGHGFGGGGSNIKSIQRGSANLVSTNPVNITINPVDISKSIVKIVSKYAGTSNPVTPNTCSIKLVNSTTIQLQRGTTSYGITVQWEVIEFNNVKSKQTGSGTFTTGENVAISSVNKNKSILITSFRSSACEWNAFVQNCYFNVGDSIHLEAAPGYSYTWEWQVIEFK